MIELRIYVPAPGTFMRRWIIPGSGIVGRPRGSQVLIDYEGRKYNPVNIKTWEDMVFHAAGRHISEYPTVARALVQEEELTPVGWFRCQDDWKQKTYEIEDAAALEAWQAERAEYDRTRS